MQGGAQEKYAHGARPPMPLHEGGGPVALGSLDGQRNGGSISLGGDRERAYLSARVELALDRLSNSKFIGGASHADDCVGTVVGFHLVKEPPFKIRGNVGISRRT